MKATIVMWALLCSLATSAVLPELDTVKALEIRVDGLLDTPTPTIELEKRKNNKDQATAVAPEVPATCAASAKVSRMSSYGCGTTGSLANPGKSPQIYGGQTEQNCIDICLCAEGAADCETISWTSDGSSAGTGTCTLYKKQLFPMGLVTGSDAVFYQRSCFTRSTPQPTQTAAASFNPRRSRRAAVDNYVIGALAL